MTKTATNETPRESTPNRPDFVVKQRSGYGKNASYERLGVAWRNDDGSLYVKLHGKQIVEGGFTLYEITDGERSES